MVSVVVDDHLLRDILTGERTSDLGGLVSDGIATTGLWLFRLYSSFANPAVVGALSGPVRAMPVERQAEFRERMVALPDDIEIAPLRDLAWSMAELQHRHAIAGRPMSAAMVEALAAAKWFSAAIAVSQRDVGPHLRAAAGFDGVDFHVL